MPLQRQQPKIDMRFTKRVLTILSYFQHVTFQVPEAGFVAFTLSTVLTVSADVLLLG